MYTINWKMHDWARVNDEYKEWGRKGTMKKTVYIYIYIRSLRKTLYVDFMPPQLVKHAESWYFNYRNATQYSWKDGGSYISNMTIWVPDWHYNPEGTWFFWIKNIDIRRLYAHYYTHCKQWLINEFKPGMYEHHTNNNKFESLLKKLLCENAFYSLEEFHSYLKPQ